MRMDNHDGRSVAKDRMTASPAQVDWQLLLLTGALLIFGMMMVYSTTFDLSYYWYDNRSTMFVKHIWHVAAGLAALFFCARLDYRKLKISLVAVGMLAFTMMVLVNVKYEL